ncbi:MAG TPA: hypothetical protein VN962_25365 [Polyangia bacterium]|nr:hypothetical protein [Polyangia bacterium]
MGSGGAVSGRGGAAATGGQAGSATGGAAGRAQPGGQSGAAGAGAGGSPAAIPSCQSLGWTFTTATGCSVYSPAIGGNWQGLYQGHPCLQGCVNQNEHYYATQNCTDTRIDPGADSICVVDCSICQ